MNLKKKSIQITLLLFLFVTIIFSGCSTGTQPEMTTLEQQRQQVLSQYYTDELIAQMNSDSVSITENFADRVNPFSTSQYGRRLIQGEVDLKDIFDARIYQNWQLFVNYAVENDLVLEKPPELSYEKYARAAAFFLREYEFDAVLYYPDEFNPVFTGNTDTWMYIREEPSCPGQPYYYSSRIQGRIINITGGIKMTSIDDPVLWLFYIPYPGEEYETFNYVENQPVYGSSQPELLNKYEPQEPSDSVLAAREQLGIIESPLSDTQDLSVAGWKNENYADSIVDIGFSFSGGDDHFTWSGNGHYVLPVKNEFWENPE
ncbi:MAG: hypothetical protein ACLFQV_07685 [Vulcanimicrobiota bacterium]